MGDFSNTVQGPIDNECRRYQNNFVEQQSEELCLLASSEGSLILQIRFSKGPCLEEGLYRG